MLFYPMCRCADTFSNGDPMKVVKKDQSLENFLPEKIAIAVNKAAMRCDKLVDDESIDKIVQAILRRIQNRDSVTVAELHELVIAVLSVTGFEDVAKAYAEYRYYKTNYAKTFEKLRQDADDVLRLGDRENANFDSSLVSTKGSLIKGYLTKSLYKQFYLSAKEKELIERGDIYIHDLRDMILGCVNCCLFDIKTVLEGGFEMSNVQYTEPKTVLSALQVIGDITLVATAQQFGGFTLAELDKVLLPYAHKTYDKAYADAINDLELPAEKARRYADKILLRELEQGFQSLELKLNTVPCSRGDFAFTTISFGQWDVNAPEEDKRLLALINTVMLRVRRNGHGEDHKPVVFPKLVYLFDKNQVHGDLHSEGLFTEAVKTSSSCMYPDYLSISSDHGTVSRLFREEGVITSPMGCRAYLSPWKDPETGKYVTIGRCNIGAVSLNIPLMIKIAMTEHPADWRAKFWDILDDRLSVIRGFLKKRYDVIRNQRCSSNPLAFTQGGFYKGTKDPDERVGDLVEYMTASFGITALDDATYLWTGKRMIEDNSAFAVQVLRYLQQKLNQFKAEDHYLYAIYGTPAESLCATQARQYSDYCKEMALDNEFENHEYYSTEYFTNSFHLNVAEDITPFEKQDHEFKCFHLCEGGHIQYVRLTNPENVEADKAIIERGMDMGFYQGVNFDAAYCNTCGTHSTNVMFKCPHCGSSNLSVISRVCGYLGYSNVNGQSRMNDGKMAEIKNRVSM